MISVSNDFKNAMKAPVKVVGAQIAIQDGATYTSGGDLVKAEVQSSGYFFGVATKTLTFTLLGTSYSLMEKLVNATLKVQTDASNDTWESCDLGAFQIVEQKIDLEKGMSNFKAYDAVGIAGLKPYAAGGLNFPCTVNNLAVQVASATNMSYDEGSLVNGTYTITEDLYSNISNLTYRDILAEVAGASASLASVSGVGSSLSFRNPSTTPLETLTYSNLKTYKLEPYYGDVNAVVLARTPQEDNVVAYPYGEASGEELELTGAENGLKDLPKIEGDTSQDYYVGRQLLMKDGFSTMQTDTDYWNSIANGFTLTKLEDGWARWAHTGNAQYTNLYPKISGALKELYQPDTKYTVLVEYRNASNFYGFTVAQGAQNADPFVGNASAGSIGASGSKKFVVTTKSSITTSMLAIRFFLTKATPANDATIDLRITIVKGDFGSTALSWEPYTGSSTSVVAASPNADYPQTVKLTSGLNGYRICGKNLCQTLDGSYSYAAGGTSWTINGGVLKMTRTSATYQGGALNLCNGATGRWASDPTYDYRLTTNGGQYTLSLRLVGDVTFGTNSAIDAYAYIYNDHGVRTRAVSIAATASNMRPLLLISLAADEHVGCITQYSQYVSCTDLEVDIQLERGTGVSSFEPFTGGMKYIDLTTGKNLIDCSRYGSGVVNGVQFSSDQDGTVHVWGKASAGTHLVMPFMIPQSYLNKKLSLSATGTWGGISDIGIKRGSNGIGLTVTSSSPSITTTITQHIINSAQNLDFWIPSGTTISDASVRIQLEESDSATAWERSSSLDLIEISQASKANSISKVGDDWYYKNEIGRTVFDGSSDESWGQEYSAGGYNRFMATISGATTTATRVRMFSDRFYYRASGHDFGTGFVYNKQFFCYPGKHDDFPDVASFKTWLASHKVTVFYQLQTPTNNKITKASLVQQLEEFSSAKVESSTMNIIPVIGSLPATLTVDYYKPTENLCEVKLANNEILDDNREELAEPILDAVDGFGFSPFTATTEGHGWYEVGDRLNISQPLLPSGYQELEYIQSTGTQYVDTNFFATPLSKISVKYALTSTSPLQQRIFGWQDGADSLWVGHYINGAGNNGFCFVNSGSLWQGFTPAIAANTIYTFELDGKNRMARSYSASGVIGGEQNITNNNATMNATGSLLLLAEGRSSSPANFAKAKLYGAKLWENDELVRNFVPCRRLEDGAIGLYDAVSGAFFGNSGTGSFTAGAAKNSPSMLEQGIVITDIKLTIDGGIKEELRGVAPTETTTNYALAGGIKKSIYNTEIKVDKQGQEITSIVSRQDEFEGQTLANFSQISQNINSVVTTIQTTGGGNLIHNSVGYKKNTDGTLASWTNVGTVASETSPESVSHGALSGNQIDLGASSSIAQNIAVDLTGSVYTLTFRAKKSATGIAKVSFYPASAPSSTTGSYSVEMPNGEAVLWQEYTISSMKPVDTPMVIKVETNGSVTDFAITDLMLTVGDSRTPWVSASDEIMSKSVAIDSEGVKVSSNSNNDYVKLDELGLNGYSDAGGSLQNVFTVNRDLTEVAKLKSRQQIEMPPLKIVPINSSSNSGWGWVKI